MMTGKIPTSFEVQETNPSVRTETSTWNVGRDTDSDFYLHVEGLILLYLNN